MGADDATMLIYLFFRQRSLPKSQKQRKLDKYDDSSHKQMVGALNDTLLMDLQTTRVWPNTNLALDQGI